METPTSFAELVNFVLGLINLIIPVIFAILFVYIAVRIIDAWIINAADSKKREEAQRLLVTAVAVFVLMITVWGIVALIQQSIFG